uniref:CC2D2AN-C2 domain-containing protein n=1 Tax=Caenorhabditis japonica TaxID=281687 RepID=A0A8R1EG24_CAEJA
MQKTTIQLILYFNDVKVASTKWIPLSCNLMPVQRRFELEFYSPLKSLTLEVVERLNGKTRVIGKASVPLPSDEDLDVALHEVEFECDTNYMAG